MLILTCLGISALFFLQFQLYEKEEGYDLKSFYKTNTFLELIKELLVILLGVTLALNFTSLDEKQKTTESVIRLLEVAQNDITQEYSFNSHFIEEYEAGKIEAQAVKYNFQHNSLLIENVLENDTVMTTISPLVYSVLVNNLRLRDVFYDNLNNTQEEYIITMAKATNSHTENILWALDTGIKHLQGIYSDDDVELLYSELLNSKYKVIETP